MIRWGGKEDTLILRMLEEEDNAPPHHGYGYNREEGTFTPLPPARPSYFTT